MPKPIKLERKLLEDVITKLEATNTYENRTALYKAVIDELVRSHNYSPFSATTIYLRVEKDKTWTLPIKTPRGKRGGHLKGNPSALEEWKKTGESRQRKVDDCAKLIAWAMATKNPIYIKLAKAVKRGSLKAAIKLKCIDCSNFQKEEIKHCQCFDCALWPIRPYRLQSIEVEDKNET